MDDVDLWGTDVAASIAAMPAHLVGPFAELRAALEVSPHTVGRLLQPTNPRSSRTTVFGPDGDGQIVFMIGRHDDDRRVTIVQVTSL